jgi:hypothetical protein
VRTRTAQFVGALTLVALCGTAFAGDQQSTASAKPIRLDAATLIAEVDSTVGDAGMQFFLDG